MSEYIDDPENAGNIVRGTILNEIITHFFEAKHKKIKIEYARIIIQMTQNDGFVQNAALQFAIFNYMKDLNEEKDPELIDVYIYWFRKYFVEECDRIKLLFNLLIIEKIMLRTKKDY